MNHNQKNIENHNTLTPLFSGKTALLFLCLFLGLGLFSAFAVDSAESISLNQYEVPVFSNLDNSSQNSSNDRFAVELGEEDIEEEKETQYHFEYDFHFPFKSPKTILNSFQQKVQVNQFLQSVLNRKPIPLFILFHSWKSFLS
jgi:hypothetical protein